jgi:hypothetical protein
MSLKFKFEVKKGSFRPEELVARIQAGALSGARKTALEAADAAREALIAPSGGGAVGLSRTGYLGDGIVAPNQYPHNASGALVKSIHTSIEEKTALALTDSQYARELNYGRQPGVEPAEGELEEWISAKGLKIKAKRLARQIASRGMAATGFWNAAEDTAQMNAKTNMGAAISRRLGKRMSGE